MVYYKVSAPNHKEEWSNISVTVNHLDIREGTTTVTLGDSLTYNGEKQTQTVIPESEYTVRYDDNTNAGTATVTLIDKAGGNYASAAARPSRSRRRRRPSRQATSPRPTATPAFPPRSAAAPSAQSASRQRRKATRRSSRWTRKAVR